MLINFQFYRLIFFRLPSICLCINFKKLDIVGTVNNMLPNYVKLKTSRGELIAVWNSAGCELACLNHIYF